MLRQPLRLILLHSASSRGTRDKFRFFRDVPFVHLHGVYTGPEFNRTLFGLLLPFYSKFGQGLGPMPAITVSPGYQAWLNRARFHSREGSTPLPSVTVVTSMPDASSSDRAPAISSARSVCR